ncbi:MAG: hypothetical protein M3O30_08435 [Planctomycetota bacterium]|nr:hypothetical protein [Planctomycetota bacterium]
MMMDESKYLREQADAARRAMAKARRELLAETGELADPRRLTRRHPWIALSTAAVGGFFLAASAMPPRTVVKEIKESTFVGKLKANIRDLVADLTVWGNKEEPPTSSDPDEPPQPKQSTHPEKDASSSLVAVLLKEGLAFARPIISSLIAAQLGRKEGQAEQHNGHEVHAGATSGPESPSDRL